MQNIEFIEEIKDGKLSLKKISKNDILFFYDNLQEEKITNYLSLGPLRSKFHSKKLIKDYLKHWEKRTQFNYIIELREGKYQTKIGSLSLWNVSWLHKRAEIGIWLAPRYFNRGFGKKTIVLIKVIAFNYLKLNRLEAHIAVENSRSIYLFQNCGFEEEGILKEYLNLKGVFHDAHVFSCLVRNTLPSKS